MAKAKSKSKSKSKANKKKSPPNKKNSKSKNITNKPLKEVKKSKSDSNKKTKKSNCKVESDKKRKSVKIEEEIKASIVTQSEIKELKSEDKVGEEVIAVKEEKDELIKMEYEKEFQNIPDGIAEDLFFQIDNQNDIKDEIEIEDDMMEIIMEACANEQRAEIHYPVDTSEQMKPLDITECNSSNEIVLNEYGNVVKQLQNQEVINCTCGYREEDGLMIQCDICLAWQHATCCGITNPEDVPEYYLCIFCRTPRNIRPTQRYSYAKQFLTLSKFPKFSRRTYSEDLIKYREELMRKTYELTAELRKIYKMERTLTAKLSIVEEPDHPKLYMWSANWDSQQEADGSSLFRSDSPDISIDGPIGEQPIESFDCRLRLLDKIEADQRDLSYRLSLIYEQLKMLEEEKWERKAEEANMKRVLTMFITDLNTVATAVTIS